MLVWYKVVVFNDRGHIAYTTHKDLAQHDSLLNPCSNPDTDTLRQVQATVELWHCCSAGPPRRRRRGPSWIHGRRAFLLCLTRYFERVDR
jgi:hypothetical protein